MLEPRGTLRGCEKYERCGLASLRGAGAAGRLRLVDDEPIEDGAERVRGAAPRLLRGLPGAERPRVTDDPGGGDPPRSAGVPERPALTLGERVAARADPESLSQVGRRAT